MNAEKNLPGDGDKQRTHHPSKDFSSYNREMCQQIDPDTQERVQLLTKKQFLELTTKKLTEFGK